MRVCIFVLLMTVPLFCQNQKTTGTVTNTTGDRVAGARVSVMSYHVLTGADGHYEMELSSRLVKETIRFSHPDYNAVIKIVSSNKIDVVLQKTTKESDNKRIIPHCSANNNLVGWKYKVKIASDSKDFRKVTGTDYEMISISASNNNEEHLMFFHGLNISSGMPSSTEWYFLEEPNAILYNRDIEYENQRKDERGVPVGVTVDIKAQSDGKFWRFIGTMYFDIIEYSNVSEETAREFDDILDNTLCVAQ